MKVSDITIEVVERELPDTGLDSDLGRFSGTVQQGVLRIFTDEGVEGNCFLGEFRKGSKALHEPILGVLKPELLGVEVAKREWLWSRLQILAARRGINMSAWAPVDIALWDAAGKQAGLPIHNLLGNQRNEINAYATYPPRHLDASGYVSEAEEIISRGFKAYKIHPGVMDTDEVVRMVSMVRDRVGPEIALMLDPNCGYEYGKALEIGQALDQNGFYWYEDPVSHFDLDGISELSRRLRVPICMSDQSDNQFYWGANAIRTRSNRLIRGTAAKLGITGLKKLCSMAEGFGYNCEIGTAGNSLMNIANLHVIYSVSNCAYYEYWMPTEAHQFGLMNDVSPDEEGVITATNSAGLGYQIDWNYIEDHKIDVLK